MGRLGRGQPVFQGLGILLLAVLGVGLVYAQVYGHRFLDWDDLGYYVNNPRLRGFTRENLYWVFTSSGDGIWKPLTWLTFMAEFRWLGEAPGPHLLINPAIHALNATLVGWLVFRALSLPSLAGILPAQGQRYAAGLLAAVWFAVHPLEVEAATWLSGRKEVLCAFFYLLSVVLWVQRLHEPARSRLWASLSWLAQLLAILSKPMAVTLPVVLVLLDMAARRPEPVWKLVLGKWPFWLLSAFIVPVILWGQREVGALASLDSVGLAARYAHGIGSYIAYLAKFLVPLNLVPYYPSHAQVDTGKAVVGTVAVLLLLALAWRDYRHGTRGWFLVILWYLAVFFPVAGWVQVGDHQVADRYAYLPVVALHAAAAVLLVRFLGHHRLACSAMAAAVAMVLGVMTYPQVGIWKDNLTLWEFVAERQPDSVVTLTNLGVARFNHGDLAGAVVAYRLALAQKADRVPLQNLLTVYTAAGAWPQMLEAAQWGLTVYPGDVLFLGKAGEALVMLGRYEEALQPLGQVLASEPDNAYALWGRAYALSQLGRRDEALDVLAHLRRVAPAHAAARELQARLQSGS